MSDERNLDVIVNVDACPPPFGEIPIRAGQGTEGLTLDLLEQLAPENVGLCKSHPGFDFRFIARLSRPRRQDVAP
jgi:hypothetical protein